MRNYYDVILVSKRTDSAAAAFGKVEDSKLGMEGVGSGKFKRFTHTSHLTRACRGL